MRQAEIALALCLTPYSFFDLVTRGQYMSHHVTPLYVGSSDIEELA